MLAAAMTNRSPMNAGGGAVQPMGQGNRIGMQNTQNSARPTMSPAATRIPTSVPTINRSSPQYRAERDRMKSGAALQHTMNAQTPYMSGPAVGGPANGQMLYMPPTQLGAPSVSWTGGSAQAATPQQQAMQAQMGVFQQSQLQSANAQNAQLAYNANAQAQQQAMNAQIGMAAMQNPYNMTMGGGGFNERGSASTPIGMHLSQLQAPYMSQPVAYGGKAVPASAYMF